MPVIEEVSVSLDLVKERGVPLERQTFDWRDLVRLPIGKHTDDAFTRVRVITMHAVEGEAVRFQHACARANGDLRLPLARIRRVEQHQQTLLAFLQPPDLSPLEITLGHAQMIIEMTAAVAQHEPDAATAAIYRFVLAEDVDHLARLAALCDRLEGREASHLLQGDTELQPGRPTSEQHRAPEDELVAPYERAHAQPLSKLHALTILAAKQQLHDHYLSVGPRLADPLARQLYAEIASVQEQHVTRYESLLDPGETWLEKWLLHEVVEVYGYWSCLAHEPNPRLKEVCQRFVDYELGHLHFVRELFERIERRDAAEVLPATLPPALDFASHRTFVREVIDREIDLRALGTQLVPKDQERADSPSLSYRTRVNAKGSPSQTVGEPGVPLSAAPHAELRAAYAVEVERAAHAQANEPAALLIDKLGERLASQRLSARLYQALVDKLPVLGGELSASTGPTVDELAQLAGDQLRHVELLRASLVELGADASALSPSAELATEMLLAPLQVLTDPRTELPECLQALLQAELADVDGWQLLVELAESLAVDTLVVRLHVALTEAQDHLQLARTWLSEHALAGTDGLVRRATPAPHQVA